MLELSGIRKIYQTGDIEVEALKGVDMTFGDHEFVAILGPSGCGKTTLLNIIGGLDRYTSGDLRINDVSTKNYKSADWDTYRNHSVGFVFQSYQLIPHQSVLTNVELTMTLSGVSKKERRERAEKALRAVGLGDQMKKKPAQMSGGQAQRAAIARALVNDPEIVLADEPTGALDTETSVQIMELLKEVSKDRLVIMVTHNPELAETYATRIIRLSDGLVKSDGMLSEREEGQDTVEVVGDDIVEKPAAFRVRRVKRIEKKKTSMSFGTALSLSLRNLMTKKGRTFLTAFAGAIGIIGIALVLATSTGVQNYIDSIESDTLSNYPLTIEKESVDLTQLMSAMMEKRSGSQEDTDEPITEIKSGNLMANMITSIANERTSNDMRAFKKFADESEELKQYVKSVEYVYDTVLNAYNTDSAFTDSGIQQVNPSNVMENIGMTGSTSGSIISSMSGSYDVWQQLPENRSLTESMYEVLSGRLPENYDEIVIAVTERGTIGDYTLYALGLLDQGELKEMMEKALAGETLPEAETEAYTFEELKSLSFSVLPNGCYYEKQEDGTYKDLSGDDEYIKKALQEEGISLSVVGIVKMKETSSTDASTFGGVLYEPSLMKELISRNNKSSIVKDQEASPNTDIFTGLPFASDEDDDSELTMEDLENYIKTLTEDEQETANAMITAMKAQGLSDEEILEKFGSFEKQKTEATYDGNMEILGVADTEDPAEVLIYPLDFETKEKVVDILDRYNESLGEEEELKYTDYVGIIMSSVTTIINVITYVLIGFVSVSLIVSSIMIGIITYISVLERTKEIGILRAIGASKRDISRVFNAETLIIGFISGIIGVGIPYLISIGVNALIYSHFNIENIMLLSPAAAGILVLVSMLLTFIGGLIPSGIAARKDPVEALRSE